MPTSDLIQLPTLMDIIEAIGPASVLDLGAGFGRYGFLCRELLDNRIGAAPEGGFRREPWRLKLVGVEACAEVIGPWHECIYDRVEVAEAGEFLARQSDKSFDLVLTIDLIEHLPKREGLDLCRAAMRVGQSALFCTPYLFRPQPATDYNAREQHLSGWLPEDFTALGMDYLDGMGSSLLAVATRARLELPRQVRALPLNERYIGLLRALFATYAQTAQWSEAAEASRRYLKQRPKDLDVLCLAGFVFEQLEDRAEAERLYRAALKADPQSEKAKSCLARLGQRD